jgi:hypothetical protein
MSDAVATAAARRPRGCQVKAQPGLSFGFLNPIAAGQNPVQHAQRRQAPFHRFKIDSSARAPLSNRWTFRSSAARVAPRPWLPDGIEIPSGVNPGHQLTCP